MKTKELFKNATAIFAEYRKQLLVYAFILVVIFTAAIAISNIIGLWFLLVLFLLFPIQFSLNYVAMKTTQHYPLIDTDIYYGFKNMGPSVIFGSKTSIRGFGFGFLGIVITMTVMATIVVALLPNLEPTIWAEITASNATNIMETLYGISWVMELIYVGYIVGAIVFTCIFVKVSCSSNLATFICLDMPFDVDSAVRISQRIVKKHKKQYLGISFLFGFLALASVGLGYLFYYLTYGSLFTNLYAVYVMMAFIISILVVFIDLYYVLVKCQFYFTYGKPELEMVVAEIKAQQAAYMESMKKDQEIKAANPAEPKEDNNKPDDKE